MSAEELRASLGLASVSGLRMFGLFVILPVFALYAEHLPGGQNHTLVGLAIGAYGLAQGCLQIPFGWLSDKWGRKRVIYLGLAILAIGSLIAGLAQDIYTMMLGRAIQGAGAISAAVMALTADLTRDDQRTKAMALIGMTIAAAFAVSMVAGPLLSGAVGVPGIFLLTGVLAIGAMAVVAWVVPSPAVTAAGSAAGVRIVALLRHPELAALNVSIFMLHGALMAMWVVVPLDLRDAGLAPSEHWRVYLPVMIGSMLLMVPPLLWAERHARHKMALLAGIGVLALAEGTLAVAHASIWGLGLALLIFFAAFNLLEASLPAMASRAAPPESKGTAIGIFSSMQFLGTFAGGALGGLISQHFGGTAVFLSCGAAALAWLVIVARMKVPVILRRRTYPVPQMDETRARGLSAKLACLPGVREALVLAGEGVAHLKVDNARFDEQRVLKLLSGEV